MDISQYKAGHYEQRLEYKAFLPTTVCHEWIVADAELTDLLGRADRALGELNAFAQLIPDIDFFIRMHVAKEATQSSKIEGTQTNMEDAFMDRDDVKPEERDDWSEVQNYIRAINFSIHALKDLPLSNRLLRQTHEYLLDGVRGKHKQPGEFRRSQNWIGASLKNAIFIPPHHEHVESLMSDLEQLLHAEHFFAHPLLRIGIAHYQFETIHPFLDGNGRLGRLLISLYLASQGLLAKPALYLSDYFERNKTSYVDHMMAVRHGDHLREWLVFFLYGIEETARASASKFRSIIALKEEIESEMLPRFSSRRVLTAQKLMRQLYAQPVIDIMKSAKSLGTAINTVSTIIHDFVQFGILVEITGRRRNRLFVFRKYLDLFQ